jgi:hypothetical protein
VCVALSVKLDLYEGTLVLRNIFAVLKVYRDSLLKYVNFFDIPRTAPDREPTRHATVS